jgi:cell division protein FtsB
VVSRAPKVRVRWDRVGRVGLLVVLVVVAGLYVRQGLSLLSTHSQAQQQESIVSHLSRQNAQLVAQQRALNDPRTIERDARVLGMVRPGERPYVITGLSKH